MAAKLGLPALLGLAVRRQRDLALGLVISREKGGPGLQAGHPHWWASTTLGADLGITGVSTGDLYAAMDWLEDRQDAIKAGLARRHLAPDANPARMALFDLSSSWLEGRRCPLAAREDSRDGKKGKLQIEYGLLTDPTWCPVAVRVLPGNTGDPVNVHRDRPGRAGQVRPAFEGVARRVGIGLSYCKGWGGCEGSRCLWCFAGAGDPGGGLFASMSADVLVCGRLAGHDLGLLLFLPLVPAAESGMSCACSLSAGDSQTEDPWPRSRRSTRVSGRGRWRCRSVTGWVSGWVMRISRPRSGPGVVLAGPRRGWCW